MGTFQAPLERPIVEVAPVDDDLITQVSEIEILPGRLARFTLTIDDTIIVNQQTVLVRRIRRKIVMPIEAVLPAIWLASAKLGHFWAAKLPFGIPTLS